MTDDTNDILTRGVGREQKVQVTMMPPNTYPALCLRTLREAFALFSIHTAD